MVTFHLKLAYHHVGMSRHQWKYLGSVEDRSIMCLQYCRLDYRQHAIFLPSYFTLWLGTGVRVVSEQSYT